MARAWIVIHLAGEHHPDLARMFAGASGRSFAQSGTCADAFTAHNEAVFFVSSQLMAIVLKDVFHSDDG